MQQMLSRRDSAAQVPGQHLWQVRVSGIVVGLRHRLNLRVKVTSALRSDDSLVDVLGEDVNERNGLRLLLLGNEALRSLLEEIQYAVIVRQDRDTAKVVAMSRALRVKFSSYPSLQKMLLATAGSVPVEARTHDLFRVAGRTGTGKNNLGLLLMRLRCEFSSESQTNSNGSRSAAGSAAVTA